MLTDSKYFVPSFHFDLNQPCYCGSQQAFGTCCAEPSSQPKFIYVVPDFLSSTDCKRFIRFAEKQKKHSLTVVANQNVGDKTVKRHASRVSEQIDMGKKRPLAIEWMQRACLEHVKPNFRAIPEWFETPQLLHYGPGGKYDMHSDSDHFCVSSRRFHRFIDRDFSLLIYLNDDYEGGELKFNGLNYRYTPKAGDLVMFPAGHIFSHQAEPVTRGKKYALVSWGAFRGTPRVARPSSCHPIKV
ncbi:MAG: 2OG-Fe(II) oxygenase [Oleiphilaceae bacterium]|nr:2OG-Fe(II) oxygenase [Oleiphilaceae bacterium]